MTTFRTDDEFRKLLAPLEGDELARLEASILAEGCRDPLDVWDDGGGAVLLDGHNRFGICTKHGLPYAVRAVELKGRPEAFAWIVGNQLGRRNITPEQASYLRGLRYNAEKSERGGDRKSKDQSDTLIDTASRLAAEFKVSAPTIKRDGRFAEAVDAIAAALPAAREAILRRDTRFSRSDVKVLAAVAQESPARAKDAIEKTLSGEAKSVHQALRKTAPATESPAQTGCVITDLAAAVALNRKYGTIYADPPWQYGNQATRAATDNHYPTMTIEQLCALPVAQLAADCCHLHLWTTNAFLFECPRLLEAWGFTYQGVFVWCKNQIGIGNCWRVSHEFLLLAIKGEPRRFAAHDLPSWWASDRGEHSAKPEAVRGMIERASPGPRLELFARNKSEGWDVWGNDISTGLFTQHIEELKA